MSKPPTHEPWWLCSRAQLGTQGLHVLALWARSHAGARVVEMQRLRGQYPDPSLWLRGLGPPQNRPAKYQQELVEEGVFQQRLVEQADLERHGAKFFSSYTRATLFGIGQKTRFRNPSILTCFHVAWHSHELLLTLTVLTNREMLRTLARGWVGGGALA